MLDVSQRDGREIRCMLSDRRPIRRDVWEGIDYVLRHGVINVDHLTVISRRRRHVITSIATHQPSICVGVDQITCAPGLRDRITLSFKRLENPIAYASLD